MVANKLIGDKRKGIQVVYIMQGKNHQVSIINLQSITAHR